VYGCTFRGNRSSSFGSGLYIHHHSKTIAVGCTFEDNESTAEGGGGYSRSMTGAMFLDCTFRGNHARSGAGLYLSIESTTQVRGCYFEGNVATLGGGGLYCDEAFPLVEDCVFVNNDGAVGKDGGSGGSGGSGGGGLWANGGAPIVRDCHFEGNVASFGAGAYFILESNATVERCQFVDNHAFEAGGLYTLNSSVQISDCVFQRNSALGGSFSVGGAVSNYFSNSTLTRCTLIGNEAELGGGGVYNEGEAPVILDSIFLGNRATGIEQGWGGGIMNGYFCAATIANCIFSRNSANLGGGVFNMVFSEPIIANCTFAENEAPAGSEIENYVDVIVLVANCAIEGSGVTPIDGVPIEIRYSLIPGGYPGPGNLDAPANFLLLPDPGPDDLWGTSDDHLGDLRVAPGSPCIDAGANDLVPSGIETDVGGRPRFLDDLAVRDSGEGRAPVVDIGAHEH
jgi:predicted outer membrane repeat protein